MAGQGRWVIVLGRSALSQAHKVVDIAVVDKAVARTHVFAETFHHPALPHKGVTCTGKGL